VHGFAGEWSQPASRAQLSDSACFPVGSQEEARNGASGKLELVLPRRRGGLWHGEC